MLFTPPGHRAEISIHAPLAGSDQVQKGQEKSQYYDFNPRSPCGERHDKTIPPAAATLISIHAPLAGSDFLRDGGIQPNGISIHAPLAGSDDMPTT